MPVLEFALDATGQYRIQVHLNPHQGPVSVMLNHSALGSLTTLEEQTHGKNFRLPDSSHVRVCITHGQVQVWRNGLPLHLTSNSGPLPALEPEEKNRIGGSTAVLLTLNLLVTFVLSIWFFMAAFLVTNSSYIFFPLLLSGLINLVGFAGLFSLLGWKRWGMYLAACSVVANMLLAIISGIIDYRAFIPLVSLALLYYSLSTSGRWHKMS